MFMCTYDTGETPRYDGKTTEMSGLECGVFSRAAFTVVPVSNHDPLDAFLLVVPCGRWDRIYLTSKLVLHLVSLSVGCINGADKHIVRNIVEMATVFEPWTGHWYLQSMPFLFASDSRIGLT